MERFNARLRAAGLSPVRAAAASGVFAATLMVLIRLVRNRPQPLVVISLSSMLRLLHEGRLRELIYSDNGQVFLRLKKDNSSAVYGAGARYATRLVPGSEAAVLDAAKHASKESGLSFRYLPAPMGMAQVFALALPFLFLIVWYKVVKSLISQEENNKAPRERRHPRERTCFADVVSKSKVELAEIVDYLNRPEKYKQAGARLPRGALLVGPSGTGKTLLAKAVAGEANCAFISASGSELVEVYVGRGAARVRDLFKQARAAAPAVLFFDEIDALGTRSRGSDGRGANDEYVQTLNQLLTELDGFHGREDGVVVLGATNRHEALDAALLRPGRFDRHVFVELPDADDRLEILLLHAGKASATCEADPEVLDKVASAAVGFSGAELANVVNEAVFLALRRGRQEALPQDFVEALARAQLTRQRASAAAGAGAPIDLSRFLNPGSWPIAAAAT